MSIPTSLKRLLLLTTTYRCCEAQERYVIAISQASLKTFKALAERERCGFAVVGKTDGERGSSQNRFLLTDREARELKQPIDLPMETLFGKPPKLSRVVESRTLWLPAFDSSLATYLPKMKNGFLDEAIQRVLKLPAVASKSFLINIGDRSVTGLVVRDQVRTYLTDFFLFSTQFWGCNTVSRGKTFFSSQMKLSLPKLIL